MFVLADESCDFAVVRALRAAGHDVKAVAEVALGAADDVVLELAWRGTARTAYRGQGLRPACLRRGDIHKRCNLHPLSRYSAISSPADHPGSCQGRTGTALWFVCRSSAFAYPDLTRTDRQDMNTSTIVQKLWNSCNILRDDGMSYGDYREKVAEKKSGQTYFQGK